MILPVHAPALLSGILVTVPLFRQMKNQYFGDINDYRKYGLLRILSGDGALKLGICWMLTRDDGSTDGQVRKYLREAERWQHYDPELFGHLNECGRDVKNAERHKILPSARYWKTVLEDDEVSRRAYFREMMRAFAGLDLVFFDPDNGLEVKSKPYGSRNSCKYLYWAELQECFQMGCSVLVYQHFCREERDHFIERMARNLHDRTRARPIYSFRTPRMVFFLAPKPRHRAHFAQRVNDFDRWGVQIKVSGHCF